MPRLRLATTRLALLLASVTLAATPALAAEGEQWEYTTEMEAMGMKMPPRSSAICLKPGEGGSGRPQIDKSCEVTQLASSGNTTRFAFKCSKPREMEGQAEATRNGDSVALSMKAKTPKGEVTMLQNGRKVGKCTLPS